jgi:hypothetical protein
MFRSSSLKAPALYATASTNEVLKGVSCMQNGNGYRKLQMITVAFVFMVGVASAYAESWKFGVMGDTQWTTTDPAGENPNNVSASIIQQINRQFINHGVRFVLQVGDLTDNGNDTDIAVRAAAAQPLIDAGIGFFPMRGNHETYGSSNSFGIPAFQQNFPQTQSGVFTPKGGQKYKVGDHYSSPTKVSKDLAGMSYSFDFGTGSNRARFVIVDPWATMSRIDNNPDGYAYGYTIADQQSWISSRLDKKTRGTMHAFVFSHQPVIAENHQDTPFSGYTNANPDMQNAFFASLDNNNVDYYISGHDHIHQRSIIKSPDGASQIEELICASNSSKFYTPKALSDAKWFDQKTRETSVSQERYTVGFYIFTVDDSCVTVDYYSDNHGSWQSDSNYPDGAGRSDTGVTPIFNFVKKETWGYCQNGRQFYIPQGNSYTAVMDAFRSTTAKILDGVNTSTAQDYNLRPFVKTVNTGWHAQSDFCRDHSNADADLASNILVLSGMVDLGSQQSDTFVLSISYDKDPKGIMAIATKDETGEWVNAVDMNYGGVKGFMSGPYVPGSRLGSYGYDPISKSAWAVINYNGNFAVVEFDK